MRGFGNCCMDCGEEFDSPGALQVHWEASTHTPSITQREALEPPPAPPPQPQRHAAPLDDNGDDVEDDDA